MACGLVPESMATWCGLVGVDDVSFVGAPRKMVMGNLEDLKIKKDVTLHKEFKFKESIEFYDVSFNYSSDSAPILKNIFLRKHLLIL